MKKFIILFVLTCFSVGCVFGTGRIVKNSMVRVSAVKITPGTAEETVICTGKVESLAESEIDMPSSGLIKKIHIKAGDKVTKGQPLMEFVDGSPIRQGVSDQSAVYSAYLSQLGDQPDQSASSGMGASDVRTITAPADGTVESVAAAEGCWLEAGKTAAVLQSDHGVQVRLSVGESLISELKVGQKAQITGAGFKNSTYSGVVGSISPEAKQLISATGQETVVEAVVSVLNAGADVRPGLTAKATITVSQDKNVLIAPYEALMEDGDSNEYVYRVVGNKAVKTPVIEGKELENGFEVKTGIKAQDVVILNPEDINNGTHVVPTIGKAAGSYD